MSCCGKADDTATKPNQVQPVEKPQSPKKNRQSQKKASGSGFFGKKIDNFINAVKYVGNRVGKALAPMTLQTIKKRYAFPAQFDKSQNHRNGNKFGYFRNEFNQDTAWNYELEKQKEQHFERCECCNKFIQKQDLSLCQSLLPNAPNKLRISTSLVDDKNKNSEITKYEQSIQDDEQQFKLNFSPVAFFLFIKMGILFLLCVFAILGVFSTLKSLEAKPCNKNWFLCLDFQRYSTVKIGGFEKLNNNYYIMDLLSLGVVGFSILFFLIYKQYLYTVFLRVTHNSASQDDYTIFVENIPIDFADKEYFGSEGDKSKGNLSIYDGQFQLFKDKIQQWIQNYFVAKDYVAPNDCCSGNSIEKSFYDDIYQNNPKQFQKSKNRKNIISAISLCYNIDAFQKIQQHRDRIFQEYLDSKKQILSQEGASFIRKLLMRFGFRIHNSMDQYESPRIKDLRDNLKAKIKNLNKIHQKLSSDFIKNNSERLLTTNFAGKAFVSFKYQHYKQHILQEYQKDKKSFKIQNNQLRISYAAPPSDVNWRNMHISDDERRKKLFDSFTILAMIFLVTTLLMIGISELGDYISNLGSHKQESKTATQSLKDDPQTYILNTFILTLLSLFTTGINEFIGWTIVRRSEQERHQTITKKIISQLTKGMAAQLINMAIMFILNQFFHKQTLQGQEGLVAQISNYILISGATGIAFSIAQTERISHMAIFWLKYGQWSADEMRGKSFDTYQLKLNEDYQFPLFDVIGKYTKYLLQLYVCMFYFYLIPWGVLVTAVFFLIQYWIDRINAFTYNSEFKEQEFALNKIITNLMQLSILFFSLGSYYFSIKLEGSEHNQSLFNYIAIGVSVIYFYLSYFQVDSILKPKCLVSEKHIDEKAFDWDLFEENYEYFNPVTTQLYGENLQRRQ